MKSPWHSLEDVPTLSAVAAEWRQITGTDFDAFKEGFLQKSGRKASSFPCPRKFGCTHQVKARGAAFVGICKDDDGTGCDDILLTTDDVAVWELNRSRLGRAIAKAFDCDAKDVELGLPGTKQIAAFGDVAMPVVLTIQRDSASFANAVTQLVMKLKDHFILLAPTNQFLDANSRGLLKGAKAGFFDLKSNLDLLAGGKLQAHKSGGELFSPYLPQSSAPTGDLIRTIGTFKYRDGFGEVWFGGKHYDLQSRHKARLCIEYLVQKKAFHPTSARHFVDEIDPYVRKKGDYLPSADIKIDHYFNEQKGRLPKLRKDLIRAAGRNGKFYLKTD